MDTLSDLDLVRAIARPLRLRDAAAEGADDAPDDGRIGTLEGYSTVFGTWYEVDSWFEGNFLERVAAGAAAKTIRENGQNVKVLFNHGRDVSIGNKVLGVHEDLREDDLGVRYQVPLLDTTYNRDLLPGLRAGAYGSSFMFRVIQDAWNDDPGVAEHNPKGIPERTITEFRLFEHGPVTFPANPAATSGARCCSMTDEFYAGLRESNPDAFEALAARARTARTHRSSSAAEGAADGQGAAATTGEPPTGHSTASDLAARHRALQLQGVIR